MSDAPWSAPDEAEILARITATDADQLTATATTFERVADECQHLTGRMRGIRAGVPDSWTHGGVEAFLKYSSQLIYNLSESTSAVRTMAEHLRSHAAATVEAKNSVRAAGGLSAAAPNPPGDEVNRLHHDAVERFHTSEQKVRQALWKFGEIAPGKIPLPLAVPPPIPTGWRAKIDPPEIGDQFWLDRDLKQHPPGNVYDENHKLYGYDEDGNLVPAFMAEPMREDFNEGAVIPIRGILQFLRYAGRGFETVDELAGAIKSEVKASRGFRDGHIDKHVREFFYRGKTPLSVLKERGELPAVTPSQREEFLDLITQAMMKSDKVHAYRTGDTKTNAILFKVRDRDQWLLVQFREDTGAFSTAFEPNPSKLLGLLKKMHIK